ncbi:hypothetical protein [Desulfosarcina ovata]|uniref:hypothetical protein n=1 Tax=Desulfosarcina ovata TaxID=83564 RepID=UPI0012D2DEF5|nr:hypothetical protein [Desulfosarcina ovata]
MGSGDFVAQVINEAEQKVRRQLAADDLIERAEKLIKDYCLEHNISIDVLHSGSRRQAVSSKRSQLALMLVNKIGLSMAETGRKLGLTTSGVAQILRRKS